MRHGFNPGVGKISWRRAWKPTPVFFPGESHGQRSLVGYRPQGHKESDLTEVTEHIGTQFSTSYLNDSSSCLWKFLLLALFV